jgi:hypothetical protein
MLRCQVRIHALDLQITTTAACRTHVVTFCLPSATYLTSDKRSLPGVGDCAIGFSLRCRCRCPIMIAFGHGSGVAGDENVGVLAGFGLLRD